MKRIVIFVLLAAVGCAKAPIDQAKVNVKQYVKTMLNDPDYYKPVSWGALDSICQSAPARTPMQFKRDITTGKIVTSDGKDLLLGSFTATDIITKEIVVVTPDGETIRTYIYDKGAPMFMIDHSFRIQGMKKQKILVKYRFYLDSTLTVEKAEDLNISAIDQKDEGRNK